MIKFLPDDINIEDIFIAAIDDPAPEKKKGKKPAKAKKEVNG